MSKQLGQKNFDENGNREIGLMNYIATYSMQITALLSAVVLLIFGWVAFIVFFLDLLRRRYDIRRLVHMEAI